jgi:HemY protein
MIRVLLYVILVFLLAAGFAWLADRPGTIVLTWQDYEIRTSLMVAAVVFIVLVAALALLGAVIRSLVKAPDMLGRFLGTRRRQRGYRALSSGLIAIGAGDLRTARRAADESRSLLGEEPLTLLLAAQAAQLAGETDRARAAFETLAGRPDTKVLGLHGLFVEARRQGEDEAARHFAEEAMRAAPRIGWAGTALFEYQARAGDWLGALRTLATSADARIIDKARARRLRAELLTARAMELEAGDPTEARALAQEAHRLAPELVPAATVAARLLTRADEIRRAVRVLETTWKVAPHPEIADAYAMVRPGDSVRDRLKRARRLADMKAGNPEGAMGVARVAIDGHDWGAARAALAGLAAGNPSERACLLMAEIEERESGDQGRVRHWLTRALTAPRDPAWVADGRVFPRWAPVSPVSGRVGAFEWKVIEQPPLREALEIDAPASVSETVPREPEPPAPQPPQVEALPSPAAKRDAPEQPPPPPLPPLPPRETAGEGPKPAPPAPAARPVAPLPPVLPPAERTPGLILAPDDPGTGDDEPAENRFRAF